MINQLITITTAGFFFLFPLFHLSLTSESYEYNKLALLIVFTLFFLLLISWKIVRARKVVFLGSSFTIPLFILSGIVIVSTLFQTPNIVLSLTTPLSTTTIVFGFILFLLSVQAREDINKNLFNIFIIDAVLLSLFVLGSYTGILPQNAFTPAGSLLATTTFLSIITIYLLAKLVTGLLKTSDAREIYKQPKIPILKTELNAPSDRLLQGVDTAWQVQRNLGRAGVSEKFGIEAADRRNLVFYLLPLLLIAGTTILLTIHLFTDQKPIILPFNHGWIIFLETLKNIKTLVLGMGPTNFLTAFTLGKSVLFNQTPVWNIIFTSSSSFFLNLATEAGIIAGILYFTILLKSLKLLKTHNPQPTTHNFPFILPLLFSLILQVFLPSNMSVFILTIILLGFVSEKKILFSVDFTSLGKSIYFILFPSIIFTMIVGYFGGRAYLAEVIYKRSLDALVNNRGSDVYNLQIQALTLNPYLDRYHTVFSQTNLALANALSSQKVISEEDKQRIPRLVQQAIDQARTAVTIFRTNVVNWDNLARIYSALTNYAKDADSWAESSYQQKLLLDPVNPNARLSLGGFYLTQQRWSEAENLFRQAVNLKPDFANAHFNLAVSLRQQKKYREAYQELQTALVFVAPNSTDSAKIKEELELLPPESATESKTSTPTDVIVPQTLETIESSPSSLKNPPDTQPTLPEPPITP